MALSRPPFPTPFPAPAVRTAQKRSRRKIAPGSWIPSTETASLPLPQFKEPPPRFARLLQKRAAAAGALVGSLTRPNPLSVLEKEPTVDRHTPTSPTTTTTTKTTTTEPQSPAPRTPIPDCTTSTDPYASERLDNARQRIQIGREGGSSRSATPGTRKRRRGGTVLPGSQQQLVRGAGAGAGADGRKKYTAKRRKIRDDSPRAVSVSETLVQGPEAPRHIPPKDVPSSTVPGQTSHAALQQPAAQTQLASSFVVFPLDIIEISSDEEDDPDILLFEGSSSAGSETFESDDEEEDSDSDDDDGGDDDEDSDSDSDDDGGQDEQHPTPTIDPETILARIARRSETQQIVSVLADIYNRSQRAESESCGGGAEGNEVQRVGSVPVETGPPIPAIPELEVGAKPTPIETKAAVPPVDAVPPLKTETAPVVEPAPGSEAEPISGRAAPMCSADSVPPLGMTQASEGVAVQVLESGSTPAEHAASMALTDVIQPVETRQMPCTAIPPLETEPVLSVQAVLPSETETPTKLDSHQQTRPVQAAIPFSADDLGLESDLEADDDIWDVVLPITKHKTKIAPTRTDVSEKANEPSAVMDTPRGPMKSVEDITDDDDDHPDPDQETTMAAFDSFYGPDKSRNGEVARKAVVGPSAGDSDEDGFEVPGGGETRKRSFSLEDEEDDSGFLEFRMRASAQRPDFYLEEDEEHEDEDEEQVWKFNAQRARTRQSMLSDEEDDEEPVRTRDSSIRQDASNVGNGALRATKNNVPLPTANAQAGTSSAASPPNAQAGPSSEATPRRSTRARHPPPADPAFMTQSPSAPPRPRQARGRPPRARGSVEPEEEEWVEDEDGLQRALAASQIPNEDVDDELARVIEESMRDVGVMSEAEQMRLAIEASKRDQRRRRALGSLEEGELVEDDDLDSDY